MFAFLFLLMIDRPFYIFEFSDRRDLSDKSAVDASIRAIHKYTASKYKK